MRFVLADRPNADSHTCMFRQKLIRPTRTNVSWFSVLYIFLRDGTKPQPNRTLLGNLFIHVLYLNPYLLLECVVFTVM